MLLTDDADAAVVAGRVFLVTPTRRSTADTAAGVHGLGDVIAAGGGDVIANAELDHVAAVCGDVTRVADHACRHSRNARTHPFNGPLSGTTQVSRYQSGKTNLDFTEARESEWQWHQLGHMQVCTSLQTDNHASTPPLSFFTGRMPFLPPNQQRQSTEGTAQQKKQS